LREPVIIVFVPGIILGLRVGRALVHARICVRIGRRTGAGDGLPVDPGLEIGGRQAHLEMHGVLDAVPVAAPVENLLSVIGLDGADVGNHLRRHVRIRAAVLDVAAAGILGGLVGIFYRSGAGMVAPRIGMPVDVERDPVGMQALDGLSLDGAAIVAVGVVDPDVVAVMLEHAVERLPGFDRRRSDQDPVLAEGDLPHALAFALIGLPCVAEFCVRQGHDALQRLARPDHWNP